MRQSAPPGPSISRFSAIIVTTRIIASFPPSWARILPDITERLPAGIREA
jgi:hypothetical protein